MLKNGAEMFHKGATQLKQNVMREKMKVIMATLAIITFCGFFFVTVIL